MISKLVSNDLATDSIYFLYFQRCPSQFQVSNSGGFTMATWLFEAPLSYWLISMTISIICFGITTAMNARERQRRKQPDTIFASRYLSIFSRLCIAMGPITTLIGAVSYLPWICFISGLLRGPSLFLQIVAMECYQLSRLYYCFSRDQVHSDKGYPKWIFSQ